MKLNKLVFAILIGVIALSSKCKDDTPPIYEISYENEAERYAKDLDSIEHFLDIHYVNDLGDMDPATYRFDSIPTGGTQTSLRDDPRLAYFMVDQDADHDGVRQDYKVYYLKFREGVGQRPTYVDSIYNTYTGIIVSGDNAEEEFDSRATPLWASLPIVRFILCVSTIFLACIAFAISAIREGFICKCVAYPLEFCAIA